MKSPQLIILLLSCISFTLSAQTNIYTQRINQSNIDLRGNVVILGELNLNFPVDGHVVVHFDGECYASVGDRIIVAATNNGNWDSNDGNIGIETSMPGFGRPFSHTRVYAVTAGAHNYYAVGQNFVETEGSGRATIYGTLSVEYFPENRPAFVAAKGIIFNGDVTNTTVVESQTIHVDAPGKVVVRFDGFITSSPADRVVLAASNTTDWTFNDGNVAVEAVNEGDVDENSFSHTRVYNVAAGDFTYYALADIFGKKGGDHRIWVYGNLLVEYFPTEGSEKVSFDGFSHTAIDLNGGPKTLTSITINAPEPGKVLVVMDGYLTADPGYDIVLAASDDGAWEPNDGSLKLQALDLDQNRYSFSHTRAYEVGPGSHTYYAVGEILGGSGGKTADLFGALTVKYIPFSATPVNEIAEAKNNFTIYPNPVSNILHIQFDQPNYKDNIIEVFDATGKRCTVTLHGDQVDVSHLPSGLLWIKIGSQVKSVIRH